MSIQFCKQYVIPYCALTECTGTIFCIWPGDGSMGRNMSPNF